MAKANALKNLVMFLGQERSSQPPWQEAQFRHWPATNCCHQRKKIL